jgi:hypothetical protein
MFQTPDTWIDWAKDIAYAGAQEAVGGFILGVPSAVANAAATGKVEALDNKEMEVFEMMANDPEYKTMLVTRQKQKILDGQMTQQEAQAELDMVNRIEGLLPQIPNEFTTEAKKEALQLLLEKQDLQSEIEGKEPALVKKQTERIAEIDNALGEIQEKSIAQKKALEEKKAAIKPVEPAVEPTVEPEVEITAEERADIEAMFEEEIAEVEAVAENLAINSQGDIAERSGDDITRIDKVIDMAKRAATSVANVLPQTKVVLHESKAEFERFTGSTGRGLFDPQTNTIHINLTDATATTVPHE